MIDSKFLDLPAEAEATLVAGARDLTPVKGLTHSYYKYPARFSPVFVRTAIETFTEPGDVCLDPHVGGGTTLVEALALGRKAVGVDISTLAEFVATVKTTVFSNSDLAKLRDWTDGVATQIDMRKPVAASSLYDELGYYKHLDHPSRWRLRKAIEQSLHSAMLFRSPSLEGFARCAILRTAQWALDGRKKLPSVDQFRGMLQNFAHEMIEGGQSFSSAVKSNTLHGRRVEILTRSAAGLEKDKRIRAWRAPKLVLTSPPYPGVHVLYHRWQVDGRKEIPLPFLIANKLDGAGGSYYTMGDRKAPQLASYFNNIRGSMASVAAIATTDTIFVQTVAFSNPTWQLPKYLEAMSDAGLVEVRLLSLRHEGDGRLWRAVPGRRWYSDQRGETPASREVVLFHRKA